MHKDVITLFDEGLASAFKEMRCQKEETLEKGHGRIERRRYFLVDDPQYLAYLNPKGAWTNLRGIGMVQAEREVGGVVTSEKRYYLCSVESVREFRVAQRPPVLEHREQLTLGVGRGFSGRPQQNTH